MGSFSLLTLNCFGVPAPGTAWRLRAIAAALDPSSYSVVCLQEVQTHHYRRQLSRAMGGFPSVAFAPHLHAPRGGLLTLTRPAIVRSRFVPFQERSIPTVPALMDWLLSKGVLITELLCGALPVVILNTHLSANYSGDWGQQSRYAQIERRQIAELAALAAEQPAAALVVVAGDLNIPRGSWLYDALLVEGGLTDPLADDPRPTYRPLRGLPASFAQAIDFALLRAPTLTGLRIAADLRFNEPVPGMRGPLRYLSDHSAIELHLCWMTPAEGETGQS